MRQPRNLVDRTGQTQGLLVVLRRAESKGNNAGWLCRCACGVEKVISAAGLRQGQKSCGCDKGRRGQRKPKYKYHLAEGEAARNRVLKQYRSSAKSRGLVWALPRAFFFGLTKKNCHYCGASPSMVASTSRGSYMHSGVDRKNNSLGYLPSNVVACCTVCNHAKRDMTYEEFLSWIDRLLAFRSQK